MGLMVSDGLICAREDCTRFVMDFTDPDWDSPPKSRAERQAAGLRIECLMHWKQSQGLEHAEFMFRPGKPAEQIR